MASTQEERASAVLVLAPQVRRRRPGVYTVPSRQPGGVEYTVVFRPDGGAQCSCAAGMHRRGCLHVAACIYVRRQAAAASGWQPETVGNRPAGPRRVALL